VNLTLKQLIAALPHDNASEHTAELSEDRLQKIYASLAGRRLPVGSGHRLWALSGLSAQIALAYFAYWTRHWFLDAGMRKQRLVDTNLTVALKMIHRMGYMRGAVAKAGQFLGNLPEILPEEIVSTLDRLHFQAPPMHFSLLREMVRNEIGRDPEEVFENFDTQAFAAATIGQVHRARLKSGEDVAVKIQYPGIARTIDADMRNLHALLFPARLGKHWESVKGLLGEIQRVLHLEADYEVEAENLRDVGGLFQAQDGIVIPRVFREYSTKRILTTEYVPGMLLDQFLSTQPSQDSRDQFGSKLILAWVRMYYSGISHMDPHSGNYVFMEDGRLGILDFGCVQRYGENEVRIMKSLFMRLIAGDPSALPDFLRVAGVDEKNSTNADAIEQVEAFVEWTNQPLRHAGPFDFGDPSRIRRGIEILSKICEKRYAKSDPKYLYTTRSSLGMTAMLLRLRARVDSQAIHNREAQAA
jgi:predicted unusual protein kinase regulating ubiquinone biosynthesis (AarF/ABC1/UbiB family)